MNDDHPGRTAKIDQERAAIDESVDGILAGIWACEEHGHDVGDILIQLGAELMTLHPETVAALTAGACLRLARAEGRP